MAMVTRRKATRRVAARSTEFAPRLRGKKPVPLPDGVKEPEEATAVTTLAPLHNYLDWYVIGQFVRNGHVVLKLRKGRNLPPSVMEMRQDLFALQQQFG